MLRCVHRPPFNAVTEELDCQAVKRNETATTLWHEIFALRWLLLVISIGEVCCHTFRLFLEPFGESWRLDIRATFSGDVITVTASSCVTPISNVTHITTCPTTLLIVTHQRPFYTFG